MFQLYHGNKSNFITRWWRCQFCTRTTRYVEM